MGAGCPDNPRVHLGCWMGLRDGYGCVFVRISLPQLPDGDWSRSLCCQVGGSICHNDDPLGKSNRLWVGGV